MDSSQVPVHRPSWYTPGQNTQQGQQMNGGNLPGGIYLYSSDTSGVGANGGTVQAGQNMSGGNPPSRSTVDRGRTQHGQSMVLGEIENQLLGGRGTYSSPTTLSLADQLDSAVRAMSLGRVAFNAPNRARLGKPMNVALIIVRSDSASATAVAELVTGDGPVEVARIRVTDRMRANLIGAPGFEVVSIPPEEQVVGRSEPTEWRWTVTPLKSGEQPLHLTLTALIELSGNPVQHKVRTLTRKIVVQVSASDRVASFVGGNWQWLWTTLVVPLAIWLRSGRRQGIAPEPN